MQLKKIMIIIEVPADYSEGYLKNAFSNMATGNYQPIKTLIEDRILLDIEELTTLQMNRLRVSVDAQIQTFQQATLDFNLPPKLVATTRNDLEALRYVLAPPY